MNIPISLVHIFSMNKYPKIPNGRIMSPESSQRNALNPKTYTHSRDSELNQGFQRHSDRNI